MDVQGINIKLNVCAPNTSCSEMKDCVATRKPVMCLSYMVFILYVVNLMRYLDLRMQVCLSNQNVRDCAPLLHSFCTVCC